MFIYLSYELFWHMLSDCQKNQVKLDKMDDFVPKNQHHWKKMAKYTRKMQFFGNQNSNAKTTHICLTSTTISSADINWMYDFVLGGTHIFGNNQLFSTYDQKHIKKQLKV